jgi:hypothetical protein
MRPPDERRVMPYQDGFQIRVTATPQQALELLRKLASEDEYRTTFEAGAPQELLSYGIELPPELAGKRFKLPPKWMLEDLLSRIDDPFGEGTTGVLGWIIYTMVLPWAGPPPNGDDGEE